MALIESKFMMSTEQDVQLAVDRVAILQLFAKYTHLISRCDFERLREVFAEDATFDYSSLGATMKGQKTTLHGVDEFIAFLKGTMNDIGPGLTHLMTNHFVDVHGDEADIISHSTVLNFPVGGNITTHARRTAVGWCLDRFHYQYRTYYDTAKALGFDVSILAIENGSHGTDSTGGQMSKADDGNVSSAAELERIAMLYVNGLMTADGSKVPLHEDVTRAHLIVVPHGPLAWQRARGAELIRADFSREKLTAQKKMRVNVDSQRSSVVIMWESAMDSDFARAITIVDRFVIKEGLITEIEIISIPQSQPFGESEYAGWDNMTKATGMSD